jgi:hypothetical protein
VDLYARAWWQLAALCHPADLMVRQFVCRAGKWHSPRGRLRTSIGCCPPVNIEPRCNIGPTTMIDAVVPHETGRATT